MTPLKYSILLLGLLVTIYDHDFIKNHLVIANEQIIALNFFISL